MNGRLANKVAIITGGCSGIGLAATELFLAEGAKVVVLCLREKGRGLEARFGSNLAFLKGDIREPGAFVEAVSLAQERFGGLDIMYHNAGSSGTRMSLTEMTSEEWDDMFAILLRSAMFAVKYAAPALQARGGGSIILTGSVGATNIAHSADLRLPAYTIAKYAVCHLARVAALELAASRIRVNTVIPGALATSIFGAQSGATPAVADRMAVHIKKAFDKFQPWPVAGELSDVAEAALFLASNASKFVTGTDLFVDGGLNHFWPQPAEYLQKAIEDAKTLAENELP